MFDLERLEFQKVLKILSELCLSNYGRDKVRTIRPKDGWEDYELVEETHSLLTRYGIPDIQPVDVRDDLNSMINGYIPNTKSFLNISIFLSSVKKLKEHIERSKDEFPKLWNLFRSVNTLSHLRDIIKNSIDDKGFVKDGASEKLASIRKNKKILESTLRRKLDKLLNQFRNIIQQPYFTKREGRYVLLVKSDRRKEIKGIVVSVSSSGATLYVEPEELIQLNDELKKLEVDEEREINRILENILLEIVKKKNTLLKVIDTFSYFDTLYARANYMIKEKCIVPSINHDGRIVLRRARHPLIPKDKVVPIDVEVGTDFQGLVLTGPNTGGKTVTLKTIGLLTLMAMASIPIPADVGTELSFFDAVLADIGDEQSIEQSLSTFSSHISKISQMMKFASDRALILLDEVGAGTDPIEGSALAISMVEYFLNKGAKLVVTTHLTPLKLLAFRDPRLRNAAVEFDSKTLLPTYRIIMGFAGSSQALEIAKRCGIPLEVVEMARKNLDEEYMKVEKAMEEIYRKKVILDEELDKVRENQERLKRERKELFDKIEELKKGKLEKFVKEFHHIENEMKELKKLIDSSIHEIRNTKDLERLRKMRRKLDRMEKETLRSIGERIDSILRRESDLKLGDVVRIKGTTTVGEILNINEGKLLIDVNGLRMSVPISNVEKLEKGRENAGTEKPEISVNVEKRVPTIDVRGLRVSEVEWKIRKFIDDLIVGGFNRGYIIHGVGSGKLARGIHEILRNEPKVKSFKLGDPEVGGSGVTVVEIK